MSVRLLSLSFIERLKLGMAVRSATSKYGDPYARREATQEALRVLEIKVTERPNEWIPWWALGDWYAILGEYAKAIRAREKCYQLRSPDPRSAYALAMALRSLAARAKFAGQPTTDLVRELFGKFFAKHNVTTTTSLTPREASKGLKNSTLQLNKQPRKRLPCSST